MQFRAERMLGSVTAYSSALRPFGKGPRGGGEEKKIACREIDTGRRKERANGIEYDSSGEDLLRG